MKTLLLAVDTWDFVLDANGNWAAASPPYAIAQDVATAVRAFLRTVWYNTTLGVDYFGQILGKTPPLSVFKELIENAALQAVPTTADEYVTSAQCVVSSFSEETREVTGQIQFKTNLGNTGSVALS